MTILKMIRLLQVATVLSMTLKHNVVVSGMNMTAIGNTTTTAPATNLCKPTIVGYNLWYANNTNKSYIPYLDSDIGETSPFRVNPYSIGNGYYICYETNPSNIEVVVDSKGCNLTQLTAGVAGTDVQLFGPTQRRIAFKRNFPPYMVWNSVSTNIISGQVLRQGKYDVSVGVGPNTTTTTNITTVNPRRNISFEVIDCGRGPTWRPDNECLQCSSITQTCINSVCHDITDLSFNVMLEGYENADVSMIVTQPNGIMYNYDELYSGTTIVPGGGGGITADGIVRYDSCSRLYRRWNKRISYTKLVALRGTYTIEIEYIDSCGSGIPGVLPKYTVQVMINNTIVKSFTGSVSSSSLKTKFNYIYV